MTDTNHSNPIPQNRQVKDASEPPTKWQIYTTADPTVERIIPALAKEIGLNESIVLMQISFWIGQSKNIRNGAYWTYHSLREMQRDFFPYWGIETVRRTIKNLETRGLIIVKNYNKRKGDNTQWFSLVPDNLSSLTSVLIAPAIEGKGVSEWDTETQNETPPHQNETTLPETFSDTPKKEKKIRTPPKRKEGVTDLEKLQRRLETVMVIMPAVLFKMERGYDLNVNKPEEYLTEGLLKKYIPLAEQLTFLKMTPQQFFGLWGEIEPEYNRNGWHIGITTIEQKAPSYMLRQNKKLEKALPPLTVVTPQPAEPELSADERIALAEQAKIDYLTVRPAVGE